MSSQFRALNAQEIRAIYAFRGRKNAKGACNYPEAELRVSYEQLDGGFCVCIIVAPSWGIFRGSSRRSYKDRKDKARGEMLAFTRALRCSRPVSLP